MTKHRAKVFEKMFELEKPITARKFGDFQGQLSGIETYQ